MSVCGVWFVYDQGNKMFAPICVGEMTVFSLDVCMSFVSYIVMMSGCVLYSRCFEVIYVDL